MRPSNELPAVYLCRDIVDFRKGINGLAVLVEDALQHDPFSEQLFVFCNVIAHSKACFQSLRLTGNVDSSTLEEINNVRSNKLQSSS